MDRMASPSKRQRGSSAVGRVMREVTGRGIENTDVFNEPTWTYSRRPRHGTSRSARPTAKEPQGATQGSKKSLAADFTRKDRNSTAGPNGARHGTASDPRPRRGGQ